MVYSIQMFPVTTAMILEYFFYHTYLDDSGFGGLVVSMLASGTQDRGFDPGRSRRIFRAKKKSTACLPWGGSKAVSHVADLRGMLKNPGFTWKSKSQAKLTGHFSPVIPSFADKRSLMSLARGGT